MKVIELSPTPPDLSVLLAALQEDDVVLTRDGHAIGRLEKFDDDDWADWQYEHSPEAIAKGEIARKQYRDGKFTSLADARRALDTDS